MTTPNLPGALAELQAQFNAKDARIRTVEDMLTKLRHTLGTPTGEDVLTHARDVASSLESARTGLREHRAATDEMARKHAEEGARWSKEMGELEAEVAKLKAEVDRHKVARRQWSEEVGKKEWRIKALEADLAARPGVESEKVQALREAWVKAEQCERDSAAWEEPQGSDGIRAIRRALRALCESAPPASLPVREVVVESKEARAVRAEFEGMNLNYDGVMFLKRHLDALRDFLASAPPAAAPALSDAKVGASRLMSDGLNRYSPIEQVRTLHGIELEQWSDLLTWIEAHSAPMPEQDQTLVERARHAAHVYVRSTMKAAPAPVERDVDRELREAGRAWMLEPTDQKKAPLRYALDRWLSAPRLASDEYEDGSKIVRFKLGPDGTLTNIDEVSFTTQREIRLDLHDVLEADPDGTMHDSPHPTSGRLIGASPIPTRSAAPPSPPRETVYVLIFEEPESFGGIYTESERRSRAVQSPHYWLAIDAVRVDEKGGA